MRIREIKDNTDIKIHFICLCVLIVCLCFGIAGCGETPVAPVYNTEEEPADEISMFAIVSNLDEVNDKITLRAVNYDTEITLNYSGGVDVRDKYGDIMSMSQVELGSIVDVIYDAKRDKLLSLYMSDNENVRRMQEVSRAVIDQLESTVQIGGTTYRMSKYICAFSDNNEIGVDEICSEDQLTVCLYNDIVCSFYVELGHGYVRLSDYASYMGGMVEIGYDVIVPVTEDMLLTVREGEYMLRIAKGDDVGTKKVKVLKNQEINVSLADIAIEPKQIGSVLFKVTPSDAAVYVDGKRINTEGAVELVYGKHRIYIVAEGYESYSASFNVKYAYKIKKYTLKAEGSTSEEKSSSKTNNTTKNNGTTEADKKQDGTTEESSSEDSDTKDVTVAEGTRTSNKVTISTPVGASVYFDGEYLGIAPISFTKVTGSHIITFSQMGYLSKSYSVVFTDDGKDIPLKYDDLISIASLIE